MSAQRQNGLVLIADDDPIMRLLMVETIAQLGLETLAAENGRLAVDLYQSHQPDLVLLDVEMPEMDGFEACRQIRRLETRELRSVPIIMVTGADDIDSVTLAYDAGATDFVSKPINWPVLGHRVRYVLKASDAFVGLRLADAHNRAVLAAIPDTFFRLSRDGICLNYEAGPNNHAIFSSDQCVGKHVSEVLPPEIAARLMEQVAAVLQTQQVRAVDYVLPRAGGFHHFEARLALTGANEVLGLVRDISERKQAEEQIRRLAYCDSLTGIPNRQAFLEMLERELLHAKLGAKKFAILFLDLDAFKKVNDTLGHSIGDLLLQLVSERLCETLRPRDVVSRLDSQTNLARLGGDEFTILIPDLVHVEDALHVAERIKETMSRPFQIESHEIFVTSSIGISLYPEDGQDCDSLLKYADIAMYHAKSRGKNNAQLYSASLTKQIMSHAKLEVGLRKALKNEELYLLYQPQVDVPSAAMIGVEALLRWKHPERGIILPNEFIPLAEETGLIVPIGEWVLRTACRQAKAWQRSGQAALRVAVNLSAKQFKSENLMQIVLSTLADSGLEPHLLELELTEGTLMDDANATIVTLEQLRAVGVYLSIDDFGTGYSSMNYLKRFDVRALKIDKSFINGIPQDTQNAAITQAIIAMAHGMKMAVVAEGVETASQLALLGQYGCDTVQGYYLGKPVSHASISSMLQNRLRLVRRLARQLVRT
jgi:diguanylate cyclase (GGDEF)-like protein